MLKKILYLYLIILVSFIATKDFLYSHEYVSERAALLKIGSTFCEGNIRKYYALIDVESYRKTMLMPQKLKVRVIDNETIELY